MIRSGRSAEAPESLSRAPLRQDAYRAEDVMTALRRDFCGKCYLCETCAARRGLVVDHRKHKHIFPDLVNTWDNLFPACRDCNERRPRTYPEHGLLNPCVDDIEGRLVQDLRAVDLRGEEAPYFAPRDPDDLQAVATARELDYLHNNRSLKAADLRDAIADRIREVQVLVEEFEQHRHVTRGPVLQRFEENLRLAFSRHAPFTALVRGRLGRGLEDFFD